MRRHKHSAFGDYDDDDLNFTFYGTPIDTDHDVKDQTSASQRRREIKEREDRPKERFHGAFTGGFSAGYWNTVGSVEGFTPKEFVSSRTDRKGSKFTHCAEDYMDEEDFSEFGIAPKRVRVNEEFKSDQPFAGFRGASSSSSSSANIPESIRQLVVPVNESIGDILIKSMRRQASQKSYVNRQCIGSKDDDSYDKDCDNIDFKLKNDLHGLGYEPLQAPSTSKLSVKALPITAVLAGGRRLNITGEAFGCGHDSDDDEYFSTVEPDIYGIDDEANYDFKFGSNRNRNKIKSNVVKSSETIETKTPMSKFDTPIIDGFVQALGECLINVNEALENKYKPPKVPSGWTPRKNLSFEINPFLRPTSQSCPSSYKQPERKEVKYPNLMKPRRESGFTPLRGDLASKFITAHVETAHGDLKPGLTHASKIKLTGVEDIKPIIEIEKPKEFRLVRQTFEWTPSRLLCKRFNVPVPHNNEP